MHIDWSLARQELIACYRVYIFTLIPDLLFKCGYLFRLRT